MKLIVETNDAFGRSRYDIHEVVFVRRQHIELPAGKDRSLIDRQILGATKARAAKSHLRPGFNSPGLSSIRIDYREVADTRHVSTLLNRNLRSRTISCRQDFSLRFGKKESGDRHRRVGNGGEHTDRATQRHRRGEISDQRWKKRASCSSKVIGEALTDTAHTRWEMLGVERPHRAEYAGGEEPQRKAEHQHGAVAKRQACIGHHDNSGSDREYKKR